MKLSKIIQNMKCKEIINFKDLNIECLAHNSMDVIENSIFFCITGGVKNGEDYAEDAINRGAKVIVAQRRLDVDCVVIVVNDVRIAMSIMAKNFYNKSDEKLTKVALIGTNGKTTTSFIIENILRTGKKKVGVIGTKGIYINGEYLPSNLTTPDPIELHYIFSQMLAFGVEVCIMEVSAHAIFYNKVYGIKFDIGVFTNITQEHLDFFHTMEEYSQVKMSMFDKRYMNECVVNIDNEYGVKIAKTFAGLYIP